MLTRFQPSASLVFVAIAMSSPALAHDVNPTQLALRPGGEDFFYVVDQGGCPATIRATSLDPSKVKVYAVDMNNPAVLLPGGGATIAVADRIDQTFIVRAEPGALGGSSALIQVCWIGSTAPQGPCPENNCNPPLPHLVSVDILATPTTYGAGRACGIVGDPVTTDDGELFFEEPAALDLNGPMDLYFQLFYASRLDGDGNLSSAFGPNWASNFDWRLTQNGANAEIVSPTGRVIRFERPFAQTAWQLEVYEDEPYELVNSGFDKVLIDPRTGVARTFDVGGRLTTIADGKGNTHTLTYGGSGLSQVSDGLGRTLTLAYTGNRVTSVSDGTRTLALGYTGGVLTSATNAESETTTYAYDPAHPGQALLTSRTRPEGNTPWTQAYDVSKRVDTQSNATSNATLLAFDDATHKTTITNPLGDDSVHTHSTEAELTRFADEAGEDATLAYDATGRRKSITDRRGGITSWTFHAPSGQLASMTEANGAQTTFAYVTRSVAGGSVYDLSSISRADGASEGFAYDAQGNLTTWTDLAGNDWSYTHNSRGQTLTETSSAGGDSTYTYNANGTLATARDNANNVTTFGYDALGRLQTLTRPDTTTLTYTYDSVDRILSITDELTQTTALTWDDNGNLVALTEPTLDTWLFVYDAMDRLTDVIDPLGNAATATYDELGRIATIANGAGDGLALAYDTRGRLISATDDLAGVWSATYDNESVANGARDPLSNTSTITSDSLGRPTALTTPLGHRTQLAYDALGRVRQVRDPLGHTTHFEYDTRGLLERVTSPGSGGTTGLTRNELGQVTQVDLPGAADWSCTYDAQGRLISLSDPLARTTSFTHDSRGRVDQVTLPGTLGTLEATWDDADRLVRALYSDGTDLQFAYDESGRLTSADGVSLAYDAAGRMSDSNGLAIGRDAAGRVETVELAPGKTITYVYDARGLVTSISDWIGGSTTFGYDAAERLTSLTRPNGVTTSYEYDADGRVTRIADALASPLTGNDSSTPVSEVTLQWDVRGNVKFSSEDYPRTATPSIGSQTYTYDAAGQTNGWDYDELGRLTHRDYLWVNQDDYWVNWDGPSRVVKLRVASSVRDFTHDGLGYLDSRTVNGQTENYVRNYALKHRPIAVVRVGGVDQRYYVHDPRGGLLYSVEASDNRRNFLHFDASYSTRYLTDDAGAISDSYAYSVSGRELASNGTSTNPYRFRGYFGYLRESASLLHAGRRFYDADVGKYLDREFRLDLAPLAANPYAFELGNPLRAAATASTLAPIARFESSSSAAGAIFSIDVCQTQLLYPTLTNSSGFDSAVALSNTSTYATSPPAATPIATAPNAGFAGYLMAQSNAELGSRFAFISDLGARNLAMGYLALVLPNTSATPIAPASSNAVAAGPVSYRELVDKLRKRYPQRIPCIPAVGGTGQSWFFGQNDQDQLIKILGSSAAAQRYWVFSSAYTDVVLRTDRSDSRDVPVLSKLPVVNRLFTHRNAARVKQALLIVLEPSTVRE